METELHNDGADGDLLGGDDMFSAVLPVQPAGSLVRYRVLADSGSGLVPLYPRPEDPFAWEAYFVDPGVVLEQHRLPHLRLAPELVEDGVEHRGQPADRHLGRRGSGHGGLRRRGLRRGAPLRGEHLQPAERPPGRVQVPELHHRSGEREEPPPAVPPLAPPPRRHEAGGVPEGVGERVHRVPRPRGVQALRAGGHPCLPHPVRPGLPERLLLPLLLGGGGPRRQPDGPLLQGRRRPLQVRGLRRGPGPLLLGRRADHPPRRRILGRPAVPCDLRPEEPSLEHVGDRDPRPHRGARCGAEEGGQCRPRLPGLPLRRRRVPDLPGHGELAHPLGRHVAEPLPLPEGRGREVDVARLGLRPDPGRPLLLRRTSPPPPPSTGGRTGPMPPTGAAGGASSRTPSSWPIPMRTWRASSTSTTRSSPRGAARGHRRVLRRAGERGQCGPRGRLAHPSEDHGGDHPEVRRATGTPT